MAEKWHGKYGDVVRIAPNRLSFIGDSAWKDIYMHKQVSGRSGGAGNPGGRDLTTCELA